MSIQIFEPLLLYVLEQFVHETTGRAVSRADSQHALRDLAPSLLNLEGLLKMSPTAASATITMLRLIPGKKSYDHTTRTHML
jgi:hypothetical protein